MLSTLVYHFAVGGSLIPSIPTIINPRALNSCNNPDQCRTTVDIIWSCFATIFGCTWVALHPNLPAHDETQLSIALRRIGLTIFAMIAPEAIMLGAMHEWLAARELAKRYHGYGWTKAHGFFACMGGFLLFEGDRPERILGPEDLEPYLQRGEIYITAREIKDKSKDDVLSKGLVVIQMAWFVQQCIARGAQGLQITELEIVTLAFSIVNLGTYALWWEKPMNVECAFPVSRRPAPERAHGGDMDVGMSSDVPQGWRSAIPHPLGVIKLSNHAIGHTSGFFLSETVNLAKRVPMLYPWPVTPINLLLHHLIGAMIATTFGAIHCIPWSASFYFPSNLEHTMWHVSSLGITGLPLCLLLLSVVDWCSRHGYWDKDRFPCISLLLEYSLATGIMAYLCFRVMLLVLALTCLRSLPLGAYQTVYWTSVIPHIS